MERSGISSSKCSITSGLGEDWQYLQQWNYTTVLNFLFLVIAAVLMIRFLRTGGPTMLRMMGMPAQAMERHNMDTHARHGQHRERHKKGTGKCLRSMMTL